MIFRRRIIFEDSMTHPTRWGSSDLSLNSLTESMTTLGDDLASNKILPSALMRKWKRIGLVVSAAEMMKNKNTLHR